LNQLFRYLYAGYAIDALTIHSHARHAGHHIGDRRSQARSLDNLASVYWRQGHYQQAMEHIQQALALFRQIGDRAGEAEARNNLGETSHAAGRSEQACTWHATALTLATEIGDHYEQARAHCGLAGAHHATGDLDQARWHWRQALALYTDLGLPDADEIRAALNALDRGG
jgi:tetratricopeptide (TPR) repeat protein